MLFKKVLRLVCIVFVVGLFCGLSYSDVYALESKDSSSILLASNTKRSVYNTSRGDTISNLNTSYYDGIYGGFLFDGDLSFGYLMSVSHNVFMHLGLLYPIDLDSPYFGIGFIVDGVYSFGFTTLYELQVGCGGILWYASADTITSGKVSDWRIYLSPRISNNFHLTNSFALTLDLLFSFKLFASEDYGFVGRDTLDVGIGVIYKF